MKAETLTVCHCLLSQEPSQTSPWTIPSSDLSSVALWHKKNLSLFVSKKLVLSEMMRADNMNSLEKTEPSFFCVFLSAKLKTVDRSAFLLPWRESVGADICLCAWWVMTLQPLKWFGKARNISGQQNDNLAVRFSFLEVRQLENKKGRRNETERIRFYIRPFTTMWWCCNNHRPMLFPSSFLQKAPDRASFHHDSNILMVESDEYLYFTL